MLASGSESTSYAAEPNVPERHEIKIESKGQASGNFYKFILVTSLLVGVVLLAELLVGLL